MFESDKVAGRRWVYLSKELGPFKVGGHYHGTLKDAAVWLRVGSVLARVGNNAGGEILLDVSLRVLRP